MYFHLAITAAACALLSSCGATRIDDVEWKLLAADVAASGDAVELGASHPRLLKDPILVSTRLHFDIERTNASGEIDRWQLTIEAPGSSATPDQALTTTFTGKLENGVQFEEKKKAALYVGKLLVSKNDGETEESEASFGLGLLRAGFIDACIAAEEVLQKDDPSAPQHLALHRRTLATLMPLFVLSQIVKDNKSMRKLLKDTVQFPSWWNLLSLSINVGPFANVWEAKRVDTPLGPGWRIPFKLTINGDPALYAHITVVEPTGALQLSAGLIALDGFAPDRPDEPIRIRFAGCTNERYGDGTLNAQRATPFIDAHARTLTDEVTLPDAPSSQ